MTADVATLDGTSATLSDEVLEGLQVQLRGSACPPMAVERAVRCSTPCTTRDPVLPSQASGTADVVEAVNFARRAELVMAIRGGGHSLAGSPRSTGGCS